MALAIPWADSLAAADTGSALTSSPLHVCVRDEIALPVTFHTDGACLEPEVWLAADVVQVAIPVVVRVAVEVEGCVAPQPVELRLTLTARVPPDQPFTAVQRLQVALPLLITADLTAEIEDVSAGDARWAARGIVMESAAHHLRQK